MSSRKKSPARPGRTLRSAAVSTARPAAEPPSRPAARRRRRPANRRRAPAAPPPVVLRTGPALPWWLRFTLGSALAFLAAVTTETSMEQLGPLTTASSQLLALGLGAAACGVACWLAPRAMHYAYVFSHELTHVIFACLCGGHAEERFRVSCGGGHVVTNKTNWLISLSPYFFPLYTLIGLAAFGLCALLLELGPRTEAAVYLWVGFTWALHVVFTLQMILRDQPDLRMNGTWFSVVIIYLANLLLISLFLVAASPAHSLGGYLSAWQDVLRRGVEGLVLLARDVGSRPG